MHACRKDTVPLPLSVRMLAQSGLPPSEGTSDFSLTKTRAHVTDCTASLSPRRDGPKKARWAKIHSAKKE